MRKSLPPRRLKSRGWAEAAIVAGLGLGLTLLAATLVVSPPALVKYLNHRVYDTLLIQADFPAPSQTPVLVGIDDQSLKSYGQWPWPRYRLAQLIDRLNQAGAQVIALDLLMPETDRTSPEIILEERRRDLGRTLSLPDGFRTEPGNDQLLAATLAKMPVVLGYKFDFSPAASPAAESGIPPLKNVLVERVGNADAGWPMPTGVLANLSLFTNATPLSGFINARADEDGILRRVPLLIKDSQQIFPNLALAALLHATGEKQLRLVIEPGRTTAYWNDRRIPLDGQGNLLLAFRGPRNSYRYLSAAEVLAGKLPAGSLHGGVAIVGAWASGLGDRHVTPVDKAFPGMEVHAVVIDTLLAGTFLLEPPWARGAELFCVVCLGLIATVVFCRFSFLADLVLIALGSLLTVGGTWALFMTQGIYLSPVMPLLLLLASCGLLSLVKYGLEVRKVYLRTCELAVAQDATILGMTSLAASRDKETGGHILRTQRYIAALAKELRAADKYRAELSDENIEMLFKSAPLHDIGKVGIPDTILRKPGNLSAEEYRIMQSHALIGSEALSRTMQDLRQAGELAYLDYACQVTISHHEKWDGSGYPNGLKGEEIPLAGRLMALADVYDALISTRVYKSNYSHEKAKEMILAGSGTHFDPEVVTAFLGCEEKFQQIARDFSDHPSPE